MKRFTPKTEVEKKLLAYCNRIRTELLGKKPVVSLAKGYSCEMDTTYGNYQCGCVIEATCGLGPNHPSGQGYPFGFAPFVIDGEGQRVLKRPSEYGGEWEEVMAPSSDVAEAVHQFDEYGEPEHWSATCS